MGVSGFTTFMNNNFELFHRPHRLMNCYIVIDGNGIAIKLYLSHTRSNDRFGGDYDSYANTVHQFFSLLKKCNVTPIILFDGAFEDHKMKRIFERLQNRIDSIKRLNNSTRKSIRVFPMFTTKVFQDIALSLGLKCIRTNYECDSEIGCLGKYLRCPILGYDSDFYFFDAVYIPFDVFEMRSVIYFDKEFQANANYIPCAAYNIEYFLDHFPGLTKTNIHLIPILLGNDYIEKKTFSKFYSDLKFGKSESENKQQVLIHSVINWLQYKNLESAISTILGYIEAENRESVSAQIENAMKGYQQVRSTIIDCLKDIVWLTLCDNEKNDIVINEIKPPYVTSVYFADRYKQCDLPACFITIKWRNTYYCVAQVENYAEPNSHRISLNILSSFHKILTSSNRTPLIFVSRCGDTLQEEPVEEYSGDLPYIEDFPNLSDIERKCYFLEILKIDETFQVFLDMFPSSWHVYLISLYYWIKNSKRVVDISFICSLLLCAIILNFVDPTIGFCRSQKDFENKFKNMRLKNLKSNTAVPSGSIKILLENIRYNECVLCLKAFLNFFTTQPMKSTDGGLNETTIVGYFSEFQSCALHIKYLNNLLCFPFDDLKFSKFFCGTFLYNAVIEFKGRPNLKSHLEVLLKNCNNVFHSLNLMMVYIKDYY